VHVKDHRGVELSAVRDRYMRRTEGATGEFVALTKMEIEAVLASQVRQPSVAHFI